MTAKLDRIRKLLAVADRDGANNNEADTARRLAERLMAAAGITDADIAAADDAPDPIAGVACEAGDYSPQVWAGIAAVAVERVVGCGCYVDGGRIIWIGTVGQRETAIELHRWVCQQIERLADGARRRVAGRQDARRYLYAYRVGVAEEVAERAEALVAGRDKAVRSTMALARRDRLAEAIKAATPPGLRERRGGGRLHADGMRAGRSDGASIALQRSVVAAGQRRLTSGGGRG